MKFTIRVREHETNREWDEPYEKDEVTDQASADEWARNIIKFFNSTCRPGERSRTLLSVTVEEGTEKLVKEHAWEKTNIITQRVRGSGRTYDEYRCPRCRITGRRFTLDGAVVRDRHYKAKVYERCDTAQAHMKKRAEEARGTR